MIEVLNHREPPQYYEQNKLPQPSFESLSSGVRLDVYRPLIKMGTEGMVAGETLQTLDIPPTNHRFI